jgi:hypothetical protein
MGYIDPYIQFELGQGATIIPMLVRVHDLDDIPQIVKEAPDCKMGTSIGNVFTCFGTQKTIDAFEADDRVFSVEASR